MLGLLGFGLATLTVGLLLFYPAFGVFFALAARPAIDVSWEAAIGGINALQVVGALVPVLVLGGLTLKNPREFGRVPGGMVWLIYLLANIGGVAAMLAAGKGGGALELFLRVLNGVAGFHLLHPFVKDKDSLRRMLLALLIAGMVPMAMGLYQALTGHIWRVQQTVGLSRNIGLYHDAFSLRSYGFMTLTGVILYVAYFARSQAMKFAMALYGLVACVVIFKAYSKAGVLIAVTWIVIWSLMRRQPLVLGAAVIGLLVAIVGTGGQVLEDIITLFSKETAALQGTGDERLALAGRAFVWELKIEQWYEADLVSKIFGIGVSGGGTHNDYLRVLLAGGVFALAAYLALLAVIGSNVLRNAIKKPNPLNVMALMIFAMWLIDTIGLTPSIYPGYQWYVWGVIGVALRGVVWSADVAPSVSPMRRGLLLRKSARRMRYSGTKEQPSR